MRKRLQPLAVLWQNRQVIWRLRGVWSAMALVAVACTRPESATTARASASTVPTSSTTAAPKAPPRPPAKWTSDSSKVSYATTNRWVVDEAVNIGPSGPASASSQGVVMLDRHGKVLVAPLDALPGGDESRPTPITPIDAGPKRFFSYGVGPAVVQGTSYFIQRGKLWRHRSEASESDVLASDARNGTRVAAASLLVGGKMVTAVAYIAWWKDRPVARLWVEGHPLITVSPEGAAASSVDLVSVKDAWIAVSLEGRSGMSPVHARRIRVVDGAPKVEADQVVWVGGSSQSLTEVKAAATASDAWGFVAIEKDTTHFGLARIHLGTRPKTDSPVSWREYPNGLDPALVDTSELCGEPVVLYARPATEAPRAPQELHLAAITPEGLSVPQRVAFAGAFTNASIATVNGGALVAYVGDGRTWGASVRCFGSKSSRALLGRPGSNAPSPPHSG